VLLLVGALGMFGILYWKIKHASLLQDTVLSTVYSYRNPSAEL
jgi:4-hydroxybenzoate polyprenyltransferase